MAPFIVLVVVWSALRAAGAMGVSALDSWTNAGRFALASTFLFTGSTHFTSMREDYLAMIPPGLPRGMWVIHVTGILEILGGLGLLVPGTVQRIAGICLILLLVGMFPANVYAAVADIPFNGRPPTPLWIRTPIQLSFLSALWFSTVRTRKS